MDYPGEQTKNVCALKVSIALNYSGVVIPYIPGQTIEGGGDYAGKYFFLNVKALNKWMRATFGINDPNDNNPYNENHYYFTASETGTNGVNLPSLVNGLKGIYTIMKPDTPQYNGITGHADILRPNGTCPSNCNFQIPVDRVDIWVLE
ncbi:MAG: T6SS effector amidase Tae4 family protein [Flavobacteriaceae bacterium]